MRRLGVLVSGRGTNLQALLDAHAAGTLSAAPAVVVCNVPGAPALDRARRAGVPAVTVDHRALSTRAAFDAAVARVLAEHDIEVVALAGFLRVLGPTFVAAFPDAIVNVHPSLLPCFPGLRAQAQALEAGVKVTGVTVHLVDEGLDTGPILLQQSIPVEPGDTVEALSARLRPVEHALLVRAVDAVARGAVTVREVPHADGRRVAELR